MSFGLYITTNTGVEVIDDTYKNMFLYEEFTLNGSTSRTYPKGFNVAIAARKGGCAGVVSISTSGDSLVYKIAGSGFSPQTHATVLVYIELNDFLESDYGINYYSTAGRLVYSSDYELLNPIGKTQTYTLSAVDPGSHYEYRELLPILKSKNIRVVEADTQNWTDNTDDVYWKWRKMFSIELPITIQGNALISFGDQYEYVYGTGMDGVIFHHHIYCYGVNTNNKVQAKCWKDDTLITTLNTDYGNFRSGGVAIIIPNRQFKGINTITV